MKLDNRRRLNVGVKVERGTLYGPCETNEYLVVLDYVDGVAYLGYATEADLAAVIQRLRDGEEPRSMTERKIHRNVQGLK